MTVLERVVRRSALALRVTDLASGRPVTDGLVVEAWPTGRPELVTSAAPITAAGVAGFRALPGMRAYEDGSTDRDEWFTSPLVQAARPFVVRVSDRTGLHLVVTREVVVPSAVPVEVALPRSTAAPLPAGSLAVTADVVTQSGAPAAWALVAVAIGTMTVGGITDERGAITVPVPRATAPTGVGTPASGPRWRVSVSVRFRPGDQVATPDGRRTDPPTITSLFAQASADVDDGGVLGASLQRDLTAGGALVLRSVPPPAGPVLIVRSIP